MQENEMILMDDDTSAEEKATAENTEADTASEEEPKPKRTRRKKTEGSVPEVTESEEDAENTRRSVPASCSFVPSVAGLIIASCVIRDIVGK